MLSDSEFTKLVKTYKNMVFRIALGYMRNQADAEDITQTVFLALFKSNKEFENDTHIKNWLVRTTYNECTSLYRTLRRSPQNIDDYIESLALEPNQGTEMLQEVLRIPKRYSVMLYLRYYEGYSVKELTDLLHMPVKTVYTQLERGRKLLLDILKRGDQS